MNGNMEYEKFDTESINQFSESSERHISAMVNVASYLLGDNLNKEDAIPFVKEVKCVKDYLESPMNSPQESSLKKIIATGVIIANESKLLPFTLPTTIEETASMVDDALTRMKVAYKEQVGELDIHKAADSLIDRATVRATTMVERAVDVGLPIVADKLAKLASANPYTAPLAPVIEIAVPYVAEPVKKCICEGIRTVAKVAKPVVHKIIDVVENKAVSIFQKLKAIFA